MGNELLTAWSSPLKSKTYPSAPISLKVGGDEEGVIEAFEMHHGDVYGRIKFRDPATQAAASIWILSPGEQRIEVLQGDSIILEIDFPLE